MDFFFKKSDDLKEKKMFDPTQSGLNFQTHSNNSNKKIMKPIQMMQRSQAQLPPNNSGEH